MYATIRQVVEFLARLRPNRIDINEDFRRALSAVEESSTHVFITGRAGTGKSTLLRLLRKRLKRRFVVLAPTGLAALNVGGQTIHSFFGLPPGLIDKRSIARHRRPALLQALDLLIIDEASMMRADLVDCIDYSLRMNRSCKLPFGGVRLAVMGTSGSCLR
jgi:ATP-dependent DNA helicase PIF1